MKYNAMTANKKTVDSIAYLFTLKLSDIAKMSAYANGYITGAYATSIHNNSISFSFVGISSDEYAFIDMIEGVAEMYRFIKDNDIDATVSVNRRYKDGNVLFTRRHCK